MFTYFLPLQPYLYFKLSISNTTRLVDLKDTQNIANVYCFSLQINLLQLGLCGATQLSCPSH